MTISSRAEQAKPEETKGLLELLKLSIPETLRWSAEKRKQWDALIAINTPEADVAAAMMLVPEGWAATTIRFSNGMGTAILWQGSFREAHTPTSGLGASTPALALIAAVAKAGGF